MAEIIIAPEGKDAIELGTLIDDDGQRFTVMRFDTGKGDTVMITMLIPLFREFADLAGHLAAEISTRDYWRDHPRG